MIFSSSLFLVYVLPVFLLLYHLVPRVLKNYVILLTSLLFYAWGAPVFVFILTGSTIIDFYLVRALYRSETRRQKRRYLVLSLGMNVGLLLFFKYANFFVDNFNGFLDAVGVGAVPWAKVALPIGISFYTFQTLSYAIDVFRGLRPPLGRLTDYLLYILSFPQMIAGPIVRFNAIADQIRGRRETIDDKLAGFVRFCIGLGKKVLIANLMAEQATAIFDQQPAALDSSIAWLGIMAYTMQIYFDFSGYSDMAIGLGRIMGFTFPENFNSPYVSGSITEFWRRWHITLGAWMRDYLYIPLGGNRVKTKSRLYFNLWFVFLISGFWHGASWNYLLWGAWHGLFLILDRWFLLDFFKKAGKLVAVPLTFLVVVIGWVFFKFEDLGKGFAYLGRMFAFSGTPSDSASATALEKASWEAGVIPEFWPVFLIALMFSFLVLLPPGRQLEAFVFRRRTYPLVVHFIAVLIALILFWVSLTYITASAFNPFIYYRF